MKRIKSILSLILILSCLVLLSSCKNETTTSKKMTAQTENPKVCITVSNGMTITLELYPNVAPITVANFLSLVDQKYYDGVVFHRIIDNFMIQTGGYYIEGTNLKQKSSVSTITGEFSANGYTNNIEHVAGVISMARATPYNSASSQFFICSATSSHLDGNYAAFGKCVDEESINNVIAISKVQTVYLSASFSDFPYDPISIVTIRRV